MNSNFGENQLAQYTKIENIGRANPMQARELMGSCSKHLIPRDRSMSP